MLPKVVGGYIVVKGAIKKRFTYYIHSCMHITDIKIKKNFRYILFILIYSSVDFFICTC